MTAHPELRQDAVSGDWILVAPSRGWHISKFMNTHRQHPIPRARCPFENPQENGNGEAFLWYSKKGAETGPVRPDWILQVIKNKYPAVEKHAGTCPAAHAHGFYHKMAGIGFHEVVISRSHTKFLCDMTPQEAELVIHAYQERIVHHAKEPCLAYVLVFHNHKEAAGATIWHPHSQIIALPIIPPDVRRSLDGAQHFWRTRHTCVHCEIIRWESAQKERVIHRNKEFIVIAPFASHVNFEMRIFPIAHASRFEEIKPQSRLFFADALTVALKRLKKVLKDPAFNFFIHTAPHERGKFDFYHWHLEILPKTQHLAGVELGTGIEFIAMPPEEAARYLRNA